MPSRLVGLDPLEHTARHVVSVSRTWVGKIPDSGPGADLRDPFSAESSAESMTRVDLASTRTPAVVAAGAFPAFDGLREQMSIPRVEAPAASDFVLVETGEGLELRPPGEFDRPGVRALFPPDRSSASQTRGPLARAFGKKIRCVYDLTAGLGSDAYRLAAAGYRVHARERHPAIFALAASAWELAVLRGGVTAELAERLEFAWGEGALDSDSFAGGDVGAYFDPMYPALRRSRALPRRTIQVLRELIVDEDQPVDLVELARARLSRVVVKRPHHAPPIVPGVDFEIETKLVRFDVYLNPARMEQPAS